MEKSISRSLIKSIKIRIQNAQKNAVRAINQEHVFLYWNISKHIVEEEQNGKERADYGTYFIKTLAKQLTKDFGSGFSIRQLELCRQFYTAFPIMYALRSQLNWRQYRLLLRIENVDKRTYSFGEIYTKNNTCLSL